MSAGPDIRLTAPGAPCMLPALSVARSMSR